MQGKTIMLFVVLTAIAIQIGNAQKPYQKALREWSSLEQSKTEIRGGMRVNVRTNVPTALYGINYGPVTGTPENVARQFFKAHRQLFKMKPDLSDLEYDLMQESPGSYHVRFHQTFRGIPVYLSDMVISVSSNTVTTFMGNYFPEVSLSSTTASIPEAAAVQNAKTALGTAGKLTGRQIVKLMVVRDAVRYRLAYRIILPLSDPDGEWEIFSDAQTGEILVLRDLGFNDNGQGYVYRPDPLSKSQVYYGSSGYVDNNNADSPELTAQRELVSLPDITFSGGVYTLQGPYVTLQDWDAPFIAPAARSDGNFFYTRNQNGFEDVMVYYHIDQNQRYLQSLGFTNIQNGAITVDPHGYNGADLSQYQSSQNRIRYGIGGVDDAEDADVILHEYGHAIQVAQVAGWGATDETRSMGEGFGDYWAGSYSASLSSFQQAQVFIWDAGIKNDLTGTFWNGRRLDKTNTYPYNDQQDIYENSAIWSGTLWDMWQVLGRDVTDKLVIKHHYYLSPSATMADAAQELLQADRDLPFQGTHLSQINQKLYNRGFRPILYVPSVFATIESALSTALSGQIVVVASGTHAISSNSTVASGVTLQINPGATLSFNGFFKLRVEGKLVANGTSSQPITFTSSGGQWYGVEFYNGQNGSSIQYASIQNAQYGVFQYNTNLPVTNSTIQYNTTGVYMSGTSSTLNWNRIQNNTYGVQCASYGHANIQPNNVLRYNGWAVHGDGTSIPELGVFPGYNSLYSNDYYDVYSTYPGTITARGEWWGMYPAFPSVTGNVDYSNELSVDPNGWAGSMAEGSGTNGFAGSLSKQTSLSVDTTGMKELDEAYRLYMSSDLEGALRAFQALTESYPDGFAGARALAFADQLLEKLGRDARSNLSQVIEQRAGSRVGTLARLLLTGRLVKEGSSQDALDNAVSLVGNSDELNAKQALYDAGNIAWYRLNDKENGEAWFKRLIAEYPDDPLSHSAQATLGMQSGDESIKHIAEATSDKKGDQLELYNYPNPFNPTTVIRFSLPADGNVSVKVFDVLGREVATLVSEFRSAGDHQIDFNANRLSSGMYLYRLEAAGRVLIRKMILVR